jgi:hypothetical protein
MMALYVATELLPGDTSAWWGIWYSPSSSIVNDVWTHVVVTYHPGDNADVPVMYIDGLSVAVTTVQMPNGSGHVESTNLMIGNAKNYTDPSGAYIMHPFDGQIADVRLYNRILTPSEVTTLHNDGIGGIGVTSGMVFQGPTVRTADLASYIDQSLTSDNKLLDRVYGVVGTPGGYVTPRALP